LSSSPVSSPIFTIWLTIGGKMSSSMRGTLIGTPSPTRVDVRLRADSRTQLPAVPAAMSSALMMSTPAATSVASVREMRASATFCTTSPIFIGRRSLKRSQAFVPSSDLLSRRSR
jgi:hypothetical protein